MGGQSQRSGTFGKPDVDKIMRMPGISGVLEGTHPLYIITEKDVPEVTRRTIVKLYGAENVEFHSSGPIKAQRVKLDS